MDTRRLLRRLLDSGGAPGALAALVVGGLCAVVAACAVLLPGPRRGGSPPAGPGAPGATRPFYTVTDLGTLGGKDSGATAINNKGEVVGTADTPERIRAFLWRDGTMHDLGAYRDAGSQCSGLNDKGQVVGTSSALPVLWEGGRMRVLPMLPGAEHGYASDINDEEQAVGISYDVDAPQTQARAVLWHKGTIRNLGTLPDGLYSVANAINDRGQVVGYGHGGGYWGDFVVPRAFLWDEEDGMREIGTLGGGEYYDDSFAYAVSDAGHVAGVSNRRAFLWDQEGGMQDLGVLPGFRESRANAVNSRGQVVGLASVPDTGPNRGPAVLWDGGAIYDLNQCIPPGSGWELSVAYGINDAGQIVGGGRHDGQVRAFLLTPARP